MCIGVPAKFVQCCILSCCGWCNPCARFTSAGNETLIGSASFCADDNAVYMCAGDVANNTAMYAGDAANYTATCTVPCKYDNLSMMVFVCHMILPMCSIPVRISTRR